MIIHEVEMRNIRSYDHTQIEFPKGTALFEGDIGSGKTTILMAIEFALFGNSTRDLYERLLRKGEREGFVRVKFEINGEEYELYRSLIKKGKSIRNEESYVVDPRGRKKLLSSDEIKKYVLRLMGLEIREKKRKSLPVVTYAIYTPQETMKSILEGKDEERLEVIRKIFKLDEYRIARDNVDIVVNNIDSEMKVAKELEKEKSRIREEVDRLHEDVKKLEDEKEEMKREREKKIAKMASAKKNYETWEDKRRKYLEIERNVAMLQASIEKGEKELKTRMNELMEIESSKDELKNLQGYGDRYESLQKKVDSLRNELKKLQELEKNYAMIEERIRHYEGDINESNDIKKKIENLTENLTTIRGELEKIGDLDEVREDLEKRSREIYGKIRSLREKIRDKEEEREKLQSIGAVCPTCRRPLSIEEKKRLLDDNESELSKLHRDIARTEEELKDLESKRKKLKNEEDRKKSLEIEKTKIEKEISMLKFRVNEIAKEKEELKKLELHKDEMKNSIANMEKFRDEYEKSVNEMKNIEEKWRRYIQLKERVRREITLREIVENLKGEISKLNEELKTKYEERKNLNYTEEKYKEARSEYENLRIEMARIEESIRGISEQLRKSVELISDREKYLNTLKERIENARKMEELRNWFDEKLRPALEDIEKMRLAAINEEFRMLFEEWFNELLGEGDYSATVDENFKPIVRYENYDMPLGTLSGGERTSVALAYRLALNTMVKRALGLKTNLLILDEPTDGFSKDQLYKLKDILDKMDTDQIIIVSHEKELRNVADTVFRVEKRNGKSSVKKIV